MNDVIHLDDIRDIPLPATVDLHDADMVDHTWRPLSIVELAKNPPEPPTIGGIVYAGKRNVFSGETESMKTWLALILCKAELDIGLPVCWVDLDAMGPASLLERLRLLGLDDDQIDHGFFYYEPSEMLDPAKIGEVADLIETHGVRLFVIDAFNPILSLHGLDPNSTPDVETFWRTIADPIRRAGAAPLLLDHVVKNAENRGKYSYGSERKASGADGCHIGFRGLEPLTKNGRGRSLLTVHKDRPGYLPRPTIGRLILTSHGDHIDYELEPDRSHDPDTGSFRPTHLMQKVSEYLEMQPDDVSGKQVENGVTGKGEYIRQALVALVDDGYIKVRPGPRSSNLFESIRPYREAADDHDNTSTTTSSPPRPDFVLDLRSEAPRPSSPSLRGTRTSPDVVPDEVAPRPAPLEPGDPIHEYDRPPIDETLQPYDLDMGDLTTRIAAAKPNPQEDTWPFSDVS